MPEILVVGAGLSGTLAAYYVKRHAEAAGAAVAVHVWDGARGVGGRLATARLSARAGATAGAGAGASSEGTARANMGAQRLHLQAEHSEAAELVARMRAAGVVRIGGARDRCGSAHDSTATAAARGGGGGGARTAQDGSGRCFVVPTGSSNDVCRWLLQSADAEAKFRARIRGIWLESALPTEGKTARRGAAERPRLRAQAFGDAGSGQAFDGVIFCGSVAEVATTHGDLDAMVAPVSRALRQVRYSRCCCLGMVFPAGAAARSVLARFDGGKRPCIAGDSDDVAEIVLQPHCMCAVRFVRAPQRWQTQRRH